MAQNITINCQSFDDLPTLIRPDLRNQIQGCNQNLAMGSLVVKDHDESASIWLSQKLTKKTNVDIYAKHNPFIEI